MKEKLALLLAILMLTSFVMVGCGKSADEDEGKEVTDKSDEEQVLDDDEEKVGDSKELPDDNEQDKVEGEIQKSIEEDIPSVAETHKDYFFIGAAVEPYQMTGPMGDLLKKHVNMLVAENVMKPALLQPTEGNFQWEQADKIVEFAKENDMELRFHTLVWHNEIPDWFFEDEEGKPMIEETDPEKCELNKKLLLERLETHVYTVVDRYKDDIKSWDVVNEVVEPDDPDGMRNSLWYQLTGTEYIETAFRAARKAGGEDIKLYINDYVTEDPVKRDRLYELVKELLDKGVPIDGVGHQTHIDIYWPPIDRIIESMQKFHELGLDNIITELDMSIYAWEDHGDYGDNIPENVIDIQAQRYKELFEALRENSDILSAVVFWGFSDSHTWLDSFPVNQNDAPFLFDEDFRAKPAYWGVVDPSKIP